MDRVNSKNTFGVPSFARKEAYNFEATKDDFEVYQELNKIAEEIEKCRKENL